MIGSDIVEAKFMPIEQKEICPEHGQHITSLGTRLVFQWKDGHLSWLSPVHDLGDLDEVEWPRKDLN